MAGTDLASIDEALTWATKDGIRYWPWLDKLLDERNTVSPSSPPSTTTQQMPDPVYDVEVKCFRCGRGLRKVRGSWAWIAQCDLSEDPHHQCDA